MAHKIIFIDGIGDIGFYKRNNTNNIKIRISGSDVKVSLPTWVPYSGAIAYVNKRIDWIKNNIKPQSKLKNDNLIGKNTILKISTSNSNRYSSRQQNNNLIIKVPSSLSLDAPETQNKLHKYALKALQKEAEELLLPQVRKLANQHNFTVNTIEIKNLKSRWGSCSHKQDLAFSLYLIQLPWHCIDYVIYHELAHTIYLNHSSKFWQLVKQLAPNYKLTRLQMKQYSPHVISKVN